MLKFRRGLTAVVLLSATLLILGASADQAAAADSPCSHLDNHCEKRAPVPGQPPGKGGSPKGGGGARVCSSELSGATIPCTTSDGTWSDQDQCYLKLDPNQPKAKPGRTGAWYDCTFLPGQARGFIGLLVWLDGPLPVDPGRLAQEILARLQLRRVDIGITPTPGHTGVLGLPTYLWVKDPGPQTLGPISDSATQSGVTVTLTARVSKVIWTLGDGATVTCAGAGTPYQDFYGAQPSPTCGHTYAHPSTNLPGGVFPVTATAVWDVAWTGGGQNGQIPFDVTARTAVRIGEVQALN